MSNSQLNNASELDLFNIEFYMDLVETIQEGICVVKMGQIVLTNSAFCAILNTNKEDIIGQTFDEYVNPADLELFESLLLSPALNNTLSEKIELQILRLQQSPIWVSIKVRPLISNSREVFDIITVSDISSQRYLMAELESSEQYFRNIVDKLPSIFYRTDSAGILSKISQHSCEIMGYSMKELIGNPLADFYADPSQRAETIAKILANLGKPIKIQSELRRKDGSTIWVTTSAYARVDSEGGFLGIDGMSIDITAQKNLEKDLREMAIRDQLTKLMNRFGLQEHLDKSLRRAKRQRNQVSIIFFDLDRFKLINDNFGHQAGDQYLVEFSKRLVNSFRESDLVSRIGGDEFVVLLDDDTKNDSIKMLLDRLQENMSRPFSLCEQAVELNYSFGISSFPKHGSSASDLLNHADQQMYLAKT